MARLEPVVDQVDVQHLVMQLVQLQMAATWAYLQQTNRQVQLHALY
jgi:hypothetical protein